MRIGLVWKADYPWDVRVEKFAKALQLAGHHVHIISANTRRERRYEVLPEATVHRLPLIGSSWLNRVANLPVSINPLWAAQISRVTVAQKLDLVIVRDLPLMPAGLRAARRAGVPIVFDMAENYPALWSEVGVGSVRARLLSVFKNPHIARRLERRAVALADATLVVVEESRDRLVRGGADGSKVHIVSNTPDIFQLHEARSGVWSGRWPGERVILYQGYVNRARGLSAVVEGMAALRSRIKNVRLVIAGTGNDLERLRSMVGAMGLSECVDLLGWVDHNTMASLIDRAEIGVIPHLATEHKNTTVPNKLFDFMALAKPVIVSSAAPLARIVGAENCGVVFAAGDAASFVNAATCLLRDQDSGRTMGNRGRQAVEDTYNWHKDRQTLIDVVRKLGSRNT